MPKENEQPTMLDRRQTPNEFLNSAIIIGLLIIAAALWVGIFVLLFIGKTVPAEIVIAASNITAGLLGFLSRGFDRQNNFTQAEKVEVN